MNLLNKKILQYFLPKMKFLNFFKNFLKKRIFSIFNTKIKYSYRNWDSNISSLSSKDRNKYFNIVCSGTLNHVFPTDKFKNILLCGQPKSASLYITQLLSFSLKLDSHWIGLDKGSGSIYYPKILETKFINRNTISHCHAAADNKTIKIIKNLSLQPLILSRNLLDSLVSRRDMLLKDKSNFPIKFEKFASSNIEYQLDCVIDLFASSYISFYSGWKNFDEKQNANINPYFITYEQLLSTEKYLVESVAKFYNLHFDEDLYTKTTKDIKKIGGINLSKGIKGRGKLLFNDRQKNLIREKASYYSCFDSEFLGC